MIRSKYLTDEENNRRARLWRAFRKAMIADGWTVRGTGDLTWFDRETGEKFMPFNYKDGSIQWLPYAEAGTTPAPF